MVIAVVVFGFGGFLFNKRENLYWSDGTKKISSNEAESNILDWRRQTKNATVSNLSEWRYKKGGKATRKHYK